MSLFTYFLLLGSNLDRPEQMLEKANTALEAAGIRIRKASGLYRTAAWGKEDQPDFLNQALEVDSALRGPELMQQLLQVEAQLGRVRTEKWGPRTIDIDLLSGPESFDMPELTLPHPALDQRRFALVPLAEIAPGHIPPGLDKTVRTLLEECPDTLAVHPYTIP